MSLGALTCSASLRGPSGSAALTGSRGDQTRWGAPSRPTHPVLCSGAGFWPTQPGLGDWLCPPLEAIEQERMQTLVPEGDGCPWQTGALSSACKPQVKETQDELPHKLQV